MRYFYLQLKRSGKVLFVVLVLTGMLICGVGTILFGVLGNDAASEDKQMFRIALSGDTDSSYLQLGMLAMSTLDETRFSVEFVKMPEDEAKMALSEGKIAAYVILPEDFIEKAVDGDVETVTYVTSAGYGGVSALLKNEITEFISEILIYSQKGAYGLYYAMRDNGEASDASEHLNTISVKYAERIFSRSGVYETEELGISSGLKLDEYFICSLTVLFLFIAGIPYAIVFVKRDRSLERLLRSKGKGEVYQITCEYTAHLISMLLLVAAVMSSIGILSANTALLSVDKYEFMALAPRILAVLMMVSAFDIMLFEIADNISGGILLHFFIGICMCYITGCMYPIYAFPVFIQRISPFMPSGASRELLSGAFTDVATGPELLGVLIYGVIFFVCALAFRVYKTRRKEGGV